MIERDLKVAERFDVRVGDLRLCRQAVNDEGDDEDRGFIANHFSSTLQPKFILESLAMKNKVAIDKMQSSFWKRCKNDLHDPFCKWGMAGV